MVFYFTGTGNSLYIAKQIEEEPVSIPQIIHQKELKFTADRIGIVSPVYGYEVPDMVKDFLKRARFHMEEQSRMDKNVEGQMEVILRDLNDRRKMISEVTESDRVAHRQFLENISRSPVDLWQHLIRITENCVGCGICEKICPSGSIHLEEGKAVHIPGNCQTCLACVHACPQKAIGLTVPEKNPQARYRNAHISLQEIIKANMQMQE